MKLLLAFSPAHDEIMPEITMKKSRPVVAAVLLAFSLMASGEPVLDRAIEFSLDAPKGAAIKKGASLDGNYVLVEFTDAEHRDFVQVQAYRIARSGGFGEAIPSMFSKFVAGMSNRMGATPVKPIRTLPYQGQTLYVVTHLGVETGAGQPQGFTTVAFFAEKGSWRKMILLNFASTDNVALTDDQLVERLAILKFDPVAA